MGNLVMMCIIFILFVLWSCLWGREELAEIKSYQIDLEHYLQNWSACKIYTQQEIESCSCESLVSHMKSMNNILECYFKFRIQYEEGLDLADKIKTQSEIVSFVDNFDIFEAEIETHTLTEIEEIHLKYCGIFLANSSLISPFTGDKIHGMPYYQAITEPVYLYLKRLKEAIEYHAGYLGRYQ